MSGETTATRKCRNKMTSDEGEEKGGLRCCLDRKKERKRKIEMERWRDGEIE